MKDAALAGHKLLIVQPLDRHGRDKGRPLPAEPPTEATIVGIVDSVNIPNKSE